jgi:2-aminomuconate deaminase
MSRKNVVSRELPDPLESHHPHAVSINGHLYVSGIIAEKDRDGLPAGAAVNASGQIEFDVELEFESLLGNLEKVLSASDYSIVDVVDVLVFMTDINRDFAKFNQVYGRYFGEILPARTTVEVSRFPSKVSLELKVVAIKS